MNYLNFIATEIRNLILYDLDYTESTFLSEAL